MRTYFGSDANTAVMALADDVTYEPADRLTDLRQLRKAVDRETRRQAIIAREAGLSWQYIGDALGMSRQAAWEKYGDSAGEPND